MDRFPGEQVTHHSRTAGQREGLPIQARWLVAPLLFRIHPLSLCPHLASPFANRLCRQERKVAEILSLRANKFSPRLHLQECDLALTKSMWRPYCLRSKRGVSRLYELRPTTLPDEMTYRLLTRPLAPVVTLASARG